METKTVYFEKPGKENTDIVLALVNKRAKELGIKTILVASTTGFAAVKAVEALKGLRVVIISHSAGSREPNTQELTDENRKIIESKGGIIHTATHVFSGTNRAFHQGGMFPNIPPPHYVPGDLIATTLRMFGHGMKVACEISAMAADAGLVRVDEEVIAIGGTGSGGRGSDTAIVVQPANGHRIFDLKVKEIICKPRL
jgi:hypothetical protein